MTEVTRKYPQDADIMFQKVKASCNKLGLRIIKENAITRRIQVSSGLSALSWGETMNILVSQQTYGSTVTVESRPKVWFNLTAQGPAERNAKRFFDELERPN